MQKSKIETYLGFCIRSGKLTFGTDNIEKQKKGVWLLIADDALKENSRKLMFTLREKFSCPLVFTGEGVLGELTHRPAVKAAAVKERNLAAAILSEAERDGQFKIYSGGEN